MGGGGSKASTTTNIATTLATTALAQSIMNCSGGTYVTQTFTVSGNYNVVSNTKQVQAMQLTQNCTQNVNTLASVQQAVTSAIQQAAASQSVSVLGILGTSTSDVNLSIANDVSNSITQQAIQTIINNTNAQQAITISGNNNIVNNFSQSQTLTILENNCQSVVQNMQSVQAINNAANQNATATQTNFVSDILNSLFSGLTSLGMLGVIIVVAAIIFLGPALIQGGPLATILGPPDSETTPS